MNKTIFKGWHMSWFPWPKRLRGNKHTFTMVIEEPDMWKYEFPKIRKPLPEGQEYWEPLFPDKPETHSHAFALTTHTLVAHPDQWDWNKLIGIKKNLFQPRKNSVMVGWRYNPINDCLEFLPYWHDENGRAHFDYTPLRIPHNEIDEPLTIFIRKSYVDIDNAHRSKGWGLPDNAYIGTGWMISPWFGGQQVAQKLIRFFIEHSK